MFIHHRRGSAGAGAAQRLADEHGASGYAIADIRGVSGRIERASTRYFYPQDPATAAVINERVAGASLLDMTDYARLPRRGTVELWIPEP